LSFPTVQLSLERKITPTFSLIAESGVQLYSSPLDFEDQPDTLIYKTRGFKANLEARWYVLEMFYPGRFKKMGGTFVGIQPFYRQNRHTEAISYQKIDTEIDSTTFRPPSFTDYFGYKNQSYGINLTLGFQKHLSQHWVMELSGAVGYMRRKVTNLNRVYDPAIDDSGNIHDIFGFEDRKLSSISGDAVNLSIHFRFGYAF